MQTQMPADRAIAHKGRSRDVFTASLERGLHRVVNTLVRRAIKANDPETVLMAEIVAALPR